MKTLVLGLGNELFGDDGVGIHIIRQLREECNSQKEARGWLKDVSLEECSLSGLSLLDLIVGYDRLIIVDTIKRELPSTGKIHTMEGKDLRHIPGPSPHYISIHQAIEIGKKLGLKVPSRIEIIAVEAKNMYNLGEGLSEEMKRVLPDLVEKVKRALRA